MLVLSKPLTTTKKGKDAEIERWEEEIRTTVAKKRGTTTAKLSKADEALVQSQMEKEKLIRKKVESLKQRVLEGLEVVRSLIATSSKAFRSQISLALGPILACATSWPAELVDGDFFSIYVVLLYVNYNGPANTRSGYGVVL